MSELITNLLLCVLIGVVASSVLVFWMMVRKLRDTISAFIVPPAEGKPSQLALSVDAASVMFARAAAAQIKAILMGKASGESRGEKAIQGDLALDAAEGAGVGDLLGAVPNLRRTLRRNPGLIDLALPLIQNFVSKRNGANPSVGVGEGAHPRFKFN